jgi:hypothetical protein
MIETLRIVIINKMNSLMIIAMLLSTASARTLKGDSCSEDYQPPNYWGKCVDGEYRNVDTDSRGDQLGCKTLVILVPKDLVGNKTLTIKTEVHNGYIIRDLFLNDYDYYVVAVKQDPFKGPNVDITFFLDDIPAYHGNFQQNDCFLESGSITTTGPNTVSYEGSYGKDMSGHAVILSLE